MTVMPPNLPNRATSSMYTQPAASAHRAGSRMEPNPAKTMAEANVQTATSTK